MFSDLMVGLSIAFLIGLVFVLFAGVVAFFLVLGLRNRVLALEARLRELQSARGVSATPAAHSAAKESPPTEAQATAPGTVPASTPPAGPTLVPPRIRVAAGAGRAHAEHSARPRVTLESLERLLGTRLLSWVGALVMLVGIAFFLKFLYERGWIGPVGRIAIGLGAGMAILALGELKLRAVQDLLSQAVSSVGIGTLFLTTYLAHKFYDFGGQTATFALLAWFAAFAVTLAVLRRGRVLAVLGFLCAYAVPILLSTGQDQAEVLFSYLALLALGSIAVRALRDWWEITPLCLAFSFVYYNGWHDRFYAHDRIAIAVAGASGLIALFGLSGLMRGLVRKQAVAFSDALVLALSQIGGLYFLWITLAEDPSGSVDRAVLGFVLAGASILDQAWIWLLRRRRVVSVIVENMLILLAAGALVLIIPAVLRSEGSVIAWSLAAILLADMGARSGRAVCTLVALSCLPIAVWVGMNERVEHTGVFRPCLNRVFVAWLVVAVAWLWAGWRVGFRPAREAGGATWRRKVVGGAVQIAGLAILLLLTSYEVVAWFQGQLGLPGADHRALEDWRTFCLLVLHAFFPCIWLWKARRAPVLWTVAAAFYAVLGVAYLGILEDLHARDVPLFLNLSFGSGLLLPAEMFLVVKRLPACGPNLRSVLQLYPHFLLVVLISVELYEGLALKAWEPGGQEWVRLAMISVAWAVYATATFWIGIQRGLAAWRWFAMALLLATLIKVFLVDMAEARQIWRVLSFLVLGTLLMGCSFIYVRHEKRKSQSSKEGGFKS